MSDTTTVRVLLAGENTAADWWDAVNEVDHVPAAVRFLDDHPLQSFAVTPVEAERIVRWAQRLPGWDDPNAPAHAPHPLRFEQKEQG